MEYFVELFFNRKICIDEYKIEASGAWKNPEIH